MKMTKSLALYLLTLSSPSQADTYVWIDRTPPETSITMKTALANLKQHLPKILEAHHKSRHLKIFTFASDSFGAEPALTVQLPDKPVIRTTSKPSEAAKWIAGVQEREEAKQNKDLREAEQRWAQDLHQIIQTKFPDGREIAPPNECTALYDLLHRLSTREHPPIELAIIVTDGQDTCSRPPLKKLTPPAFPLKVVMVVANTSAKHAQYRDHFEKTRQHWSAIAPDWVRVISTTEIPSIAATP
jgi:hypothetical protein